MSLVQLEEFQGPQFLGFVRNLPDPVGFTASAFLPDRTVFDLEVEYVKAAENNTVMAEILGWDSEAPLSPRPGLGEKVRFDLPPIKRKSRVSEKEIIRFLSPRAGSPDVQTAIDAVYDDTRRLVDGVKARVEWMRMQALSEDTLSYSEGGVEFAFDYGVLTTHQFDAVADMPTGVYWDVVATADPIADLQYMLGVYKAAKGFSWTNFVISETVLPYLLRNEAMKTYLFGAGNEPGRQLTQAEVNSVMSIYGLPNIVTYDAKVYQENADGSVSTLTPLDPKKGVLLPQAGVFVGETLWGPTAESRALIGTNLAAQSPGIYPVAYGKEDPPSEWVKVAAVAIPSMPGADHVGQAQLITP